MATIQEKKDRINAANEELREVIGASVGLTDSEGIEWYANKVSEAIADTPYEQTIGNRTTADGSSIRDGVAFVDKVKGNTIKVNQLYNSQPFERVFEGITFVFDGEYISANGTATNIAYVAKGIMVTKGHKYLVSSSPKGGSSTTYCAYFTGVRVTALSSSDYGNGTLVECSETGEVYLVPARVEKGVTVSNLRFKPQIFDLTAMGWADITTAEEFAQRLGYESVFDIPPMPYDEGSLLSFSADKLVSKGRNQFDMDKAYTGVANISKTDEGYVGTIQSFLVAYNKSSNKPLWVNEHNIAGAICVTAKAKTSGSASPRIIVAYTDGTTSVLSPFATNTTFATKSVLTEASKVVSAIYHDYGSGASVIMTIAELLIAFSNVALPYEPYREDSELPLPTILHEGTPLFPDGLLSAGTAHDEVDLANGRAVKRIGKVDLGSLIWSYNSLYNAWSTSGLTTIAKIYSSSSKNIVHKTYNVDLSILTNKVANTMILESSGSLWVNDGSSTEKPSGVLYYELATPIEVSFPPCKAYYKVSNGGKEAIVGDSAPMVADIGYRYEMGATMSLEESAETDQ